MKHCTYCGKQHPDEAIACEIDAMPLRHVPLPEWVGENQKIIAAEHIRLLAIGHWFFGGLTLGAVPLLWLYFWSRLNWGPRPDEWFHQRTILIPPEMLNLHVSIYFLITLILVGLAITNFTTGFCLTRKKRRDFSMRVACINCLLIPLGTFLGILTLVVLSRSSAQSLYAVKNT